MTENQILSRVEKLCKIRNALYLYPVAQKILQTEIDNLRKLLAATITA